MKKVSNKEMLKIIESASKDRKKTIHITDKSELSHDDKMKIGLCKHFVRYMTKHRMFASELAAKLNIPKSRMSEITNYKIKLFTLEKLIHNLELLAEHDPSINAYLDTLTKFTEIAAPSVSRSRQLAKEFNEVSQNI